MWGRLSTTIIFWNIHKKRNDNNNDDDDDDGDDDDDKKLGFFQVFSYLSYLAESTVSGDLRQVQAIERKSYAHGYGSDAGGGNTAMLLK